MLCMLRAPYHRAHRMAVGLEVQSEKVEGDRLGDYVTHCPRSPRPQVTWADYVREGKVLRVFSSGRYFSRNQE